MTRKMNKLPVMEQFLTLQGEGYHTGRSAVFVRLEGCDVGVFGVMSKKVGMRIYTLL